MNRLKNDVTPRTVPQTGTPGTQSTAPTPATSGAAPANNVQVAHESTDFRPLTAGEIQPGERVIKEFPNPLYGAEKLKQIAQAATGEVAGILAKGAAAAERIGNSQALGGRRSEEGDDKNAGRLIRQVRIYNGVHTVRTVFQPDSGRPVPVDPEKVVGIPNGAVVKLEPDGSLDTSGARPLTNMVGTVEKQDGRFVVTSKTALSPIHVLPLEGGSDDLVGKLVVVDVQDAASPKRRGLVHDVLTPKTDMQRLELTSAADAGVAITFPPDVLAQLQQLMANPPRFELQPGMRDYTGATVIATDNPGSHSDYRSVDPEQASNVSFENGRMVLIDFLANREKVVPNGSPIDAHAMDVMLTFYGSGFDAAALPKELSEDLAVFLQDLPRYATAVKAVFDVVPSEPKTEGLTADEAKVAALIDGKRTLAEIGEKLGDVDLATRVVQQLRDADQLTVKTELRLDDSEVFDALVKNRWAGSYRDADRVYAAEKGDAQFEGVVKSLPPGVKEQLDLFKFAGHALRKTAEERGQLNAGNDNDGRYQSEQVREAFSTIISEVVPLIANKAGVDTIGRYHPEAKEEKLRRFREFAEAFGVPWPENETFPEYVDKVPERVQAKFADRSEAEREMITDALRGQAYRSLEKAIYQVDGGGHSGLAKAVYAHSTASNRQNTGKPNLEQATYATAKLQGRATGSAPYTREQLVDIAEHATDVELLYSRVVERQIENLRNAVALKPLEGQTVKALVVGVNPGGVELQTLEPSARLFVPLAVLGNLLHDRVDVTDSNTAVQAQHLDVALSVAQSIDVKIKSVDAELGSIDAEPVIANLDEVLRNRRPDEGGGHDRGNQGRGNDWNRDDRNSRQDGRDDRGGRNHGRHHHR